MNARPAPPPAHDGFFDLSLALLCVADFDGFFRELNPAWQETLGWPIAELKAKPYLEFVHPEDRAKTSLEVEKLLKGSAAASFENRYRCQDGSYKWIAWNAAAFPKERLIRAIARDVTEQKRLEQMRDEIVEMTTHELRTPLTAIHAALHLMLSGDFGPLPQAHRKFAEMAYGNCERMTRMINDFLDMEKIESGRAELKKVPIEMAPLLEAAILANSSYAGRFQVSFTLKRPPAPLWVAADNDALISVLTNLLSNAAKFSHQKGTVDVSLESRDGMARVSVVDHGPGIPQEFRDRIFQRYAQVGGADPQKKGSGLGLRIAKDIVELLGGTIGFTTQDGAGSTFYFDLPELREGQAHV